MLAYARPRSSRPTAPIGFFSQNASSLIKRARRWLEPRHTGHAPSQLCILLQKLLLRKDAVFRNRAADTHASVSQSINQQAIDSNTDRHVPLLAFPMDIVKLFAYSTS